MGGTSASTQGQANAPFIGGPSDPSYTADPLIESLKYLSGSMGYGPNSKAPPSAPALTPAPSPQMSSGSDYTIPPDPLIETLKWLTGAGASAAPKRR